MPPRGAPSESGPGRSLQAPAREAKTPVHPADLSVDPSLAAVSLPLEPVFPQEDRGTRLVLYAGPPGELRVHWRLERDDFERAAGSFPPAGQRPRAVLRLRRDRPEGGSDQAADEIPLGPDLGDGCGDCRIGVPADHCLYRAELGLRNSDGGWLMLVRSNALYGAAGVGLDLGRLPRDPLGPSPSPLSQDAQAMSGPASVAPAVAREPGAQDQGALVVEPALAEAPGVTLAREFPLVPWASGLQVPQSSPGGTVPPSASLVGVAKGYGADTQGLGMVTQVAGAPPFEAAAMGLHAAQMPAPGTRQGAGPEPLGCESPRIGVTLAPLTYERPPERVNGVELEAELRISGRAPPGSVIDLFGLPYRVGPGGRFQLSFPVTDPQILRLALRASPLAGLEGPQDP